MLGARFVERDGFLTVAHGIGGCPVKVDAVG